MAVPLESPSHERSCKRRWIGGGAVKDLSHLIFLLLAPAVLFRAMSTVHVEQLSLKPVAAYFIASGLLFAGTLALRGFNRTAAVIALANTYSNTVMIGIALIGLAYGEAGMVVLLTLISLHSLVLLTSATVVLELAVARGKKSYDKRAALKEKDLRREADQAVRERRIR